jgi:predicted short-subunit dehydrogenase-like oxidoreductase (DUF2520 family)
MELAVVGAGRVGTALAVLLSRAGHRVAAVSGRADTAGRAARFLPGVPVVTDEQAAASAEVVVLGVPDSAIEPTAAGIAPHLRPGAALVHLSGALDMSVLHAAEAAGATPLAVHPLQTFPTVESGLARLPGSAAAVTARTDEGFALGERLAGDAGAVPFRLPDEARPLYHAGAVLASNALVALMALAEQVLETAGVDDPLRKLLPLSLASLENAGTMGAVEALTGPVARGDARTVERNLVALTERSPGTVPAYVALAEAAASLAASGGRLTDQARSAVEAVLARWK